MTLRIMHPAKLQKLYAGEKWIYADDDLYIYQSIEKKYYGSSERLIGAQIFQERASTLRAAFVEWIDDCLKDRCQKEWLTTPFQKNPFECHLFLHLVWIDLIREILEKGSPTVVVVTADMGLAKSLQNLTRSMQMKSCLVGREWFWVGSLHRTTRALAKLSFETVNILCRVLLSNLILGKHYLRRATGTELLLDTYLHEGDIMPNGEYRDRYFPGLLQYYLEHDYRVATFPYLFRIPIARLIALYRQIRESRYIFVLPESFLKIKDIIVAFVESTLMAFPKETAVFRGLNVSPLIAGQKIKFALGGFIPLLLEKMPKRMAQAGVKPMWVVDWFENNPLDKALCIGFGKYQPQCQVIGVAQYVSCGNDFYIFSSNGEFSAGVVPKENWFCGSELKNIAETYGAIDNYRIVPALRYSYLYHNPHAIAKGDTLLVLLTHSVQESAYILDCVAPLCREERIGISRLVVKTHPDLNIALFRQEAEQQFPALKINAVEWTNRNMGELLQNAKVVVTSGSSAAVEAICHGIPVVLIGRRAGLNFNPLERIDPKMWAMAYTTNDLREAIAQRFCEGELSSAERSAIAESAQKTFFMKTGSDEMRRFLPTA